MSSQSQTPSMMRPLTLSDSQILELVYQYCNVVNKDGDNFDVDVLFGVVSDIMRPSVSAAHPSIKVNGWRPRIKAGFRAQRIVTRILTDVPPNERSLRIEPKPRNCYGLKTEEEGKATSKMEPPIQTLKHIACQMMKTPQDENHSYAHETTIYILEELKAYSGDAKAVIALAAFSLEYGNFWHLSKLPREDDLGRSLALLNNVQVDEADYNNNNNICEYNLLVKNIFEAVKSMVELEKLLKQALQGYEEQIEDKDDIVVPTLKEAMHDFPVFVYWIVLAIVVSALHLNFVSNYREGKYELFNISSKISNVHSKLRALLGMIRKEIAQRDDYLRSQRELQTPTEIAEIFLEGSDNDLSQ